MHNQKLKKFVANQITSVLDRTLSTKANTASCSLWYEPKAPDNLAKYRKNNK